MGWAGRGGGGGGGGCEDTWVGKCEGLVLVAFLFLLPVFPAYMPIFVTIPAESGVSKIRAQPHQV